MRTKAQLDNLRPFSSTHQPKKRKGKTTEGFYLTPILKKLLNKEMEISDPEVQQVLGLKDGTKAEMKKIIMLRYILNAMQGENKAIEGIMDRIDGKPPDTVIDNSQHTHYTTVKVEVNDNTEIPLAHETRNRLQRQT